MKKQIPIIQYVNDPRYKESIITQNNQNRPFASINGVDVKKIAEEQPYLMVEVDADDGSLVGVPNSKDLTTYYTTQGKRYDKQSDGNWMDEDGHLWSRDDSGNFSIVSRNPETVTVGQNLADNYNSISDSISDWLSTPITVAGDMDSVGGYDTEYTTTPASEIQIMLAPFIWSKPVQTMTAIGGAYAGSEIGRNVGKGLAYFSSEDPGIQKASERAGEFTGSLIGGGITTSKLYPKVLKITKHIPDGLKLYSTEQLQINPSKQFVKFQERPSKLTKKELLGIPKGERNQPLNTHLKGDNAVIMFKEYGSDVTIPDNSINYNILLKYVPEARERYGIIGRKDISDEEIARALYKRIQGLSKETGALNEVKEPQLLFRGDTRNYNSLKIRMAPTQLIDKKGTMDNSLGTLFLGEYPGTLPDRYDAVGVTRYLSGKVYNPIINEWKWRASSTSSAVPTEHTSGYRVFFEPSLGHRGTPIGFVKDLSTAQNPNHLNAFIVKTPYVRDATKEISVLDDDAFITGFDKAQYKGKQVLDRTKDYSDSEIRKLMGDHYTQVLKDAEAKQQGLLKSDAGSSLREEHTKYTYFAVPNFNRFNVKHILPYDLRIPTDWNSYNIYKKNGGKLIRYFNN